MCPKATRTTTRRWLDLLPVIILLLSSVQMSRAQGPYTPLAGSQCDLGRATWYEVTSIGNCGFDGISIFNNGFDLDFGVAPNSYFYFNDTQCGECYQIIGPYGARDTFQTDPKPTVVMVVDQCPVVGNEQWCSGDMVNFDMRKGAWNSLTNGNTGFEPFLFTYQKVACPFNAQQTPVSIQIVDVNAYYISFRPFFQALAIQNTLQIQESGSTTWASTNLMTADFQFSYQNGQQLKYPMTVRITALSTGETIDVTISSTPSNNDVYSSEKLFSISSVAQKPPLECTYYVDPVVYNGESLQRPVAPNHKTADDWVIYNNSVTYNLYSTAVPPTVGQYVLETSMSDYGTFQIAREAPIYKSNAIALEFDICSNKTQPSNLLSLSFNGAGGSSGASELYYVTPIDTKWNTYRIYLNTSDIPAELYIIYFQYQSTGSDIFYFDNITWILSNNYTVASSGHVNPTQAAIILYLLAVVLMVFCVL
jgi:hypothetical protein